MHKNNLLYVENTAVSEGGTATMRINKPIGDAEGKISAPEFTAELDFLVNMGVEKIIFSINSPGGSVMHGFEIFSAIQDLEIETETRVVGIAASIAGIIAQAGDKRTIKPYALFMAHSPAPAKGKTASARVLELAYNSIKSILQSKSNISDEKIKDILSRDTFYDAAEAYENGLFDEVLDFEGVAPEISAKMEAVEVMNLVNEFNVKLINKMSKLNEVLGLQNEASESAQIAELEKIKAKAAEVEILENKVSTLETEKAALEAQLSEGRKAKATELIENAVNLGKLKFSDEDEKQKAIDNAVENYEGVAAMIAGISTVQVANHIEIDNGEKDSRKDWDYDRWSKEDPEGLKKMRNENPEQFIKLQNELLND